ncbi:MAG: thiamine-phosphate kinase [Candidatus Melainabacteria bacterium]|nr:thiamine-phosphate kinase [Candidatus Melainabacteria bacterium]
MNIKTYPQTTEMCLIEAIKGWTGSTCIGDDCAVLPQQRLATSDCLVEGTHFVSEQIGPQDLGWKAVSVNLSDIAAMAGKPQHLIVNLVLPKNFSQGYFRKLYLSMVECAHSYRTTIVGGDLTHGALLVISICALGEEHEAGCLRRSGAMPGDIVAVTGDFGASAAGLWAITNQINGHEFLKTRHCRPCPRLREAWALVSRTGSRGALMDASDGLGDALSQIARASQVGIEINLKSVPIAQQTLIAAQAASVDPYHWALYGGEDYELVAAIPEHVWDKWQTEPDNPFYAIGSVTDSNLVMARHPKMGQVAIDLSHTFQHWS